MTELQQQALIAELQQEVATLQAKIAEAEAANQADAQEKARVAALGPRIAELQKQKAELRALLDSILDPAEQA